MIRAIALESGDNVATMVDPGTEGQQVTLAGEGSGSLTLRTDVPFGHKVAIRSIEAGEHILKYGKVIGKATQAIDIGAHVHVHNVEALRARGDRKDSQ